MATSEDRLLEDVLMFVDKSRNQGSYRHYVLTRNYSGIRWSVFWWLLHKVARKEWARSSRAERGEAAAEHQDYGPFSGDLF